MKKLLFCGLCILFVFQLNAQTPSFDLKWVNTFEKASVRDIEVDAVGNCYIVGTFLDTVDFDLSVGITELIADTSYGAFLAKYDPSGVLVYVKQLPGTSKNNIGLDKTGNIWVAAQFKNTVDIDPGTGVQNITAYQGTSSIYQSDYYVAKFDNNGNYLNSFTLVDSADAIDILDITVDLNDNVLLAGDFENTVDFDPGSGMTNLIGPNNNGNIFVAKYDPSGNLLFAHHLATQGTTLSCFANKVRTDLNNNIYVSGYFHGNIDLDPSSATYIVNDIDGIDGFVAKYNSSGVFQFGGGFHGTCRGLSVNPNGDFYISGTLPDSMDVDMGSGTTMLYSSNVFDVWLAHYDNMGNFMSAKAFEGNNVYSVNDMTVDPSQNVLMAGFIRDTVDYNPAGTGGEFISKGNKDLSVMKFDKSINLNRGMALGGSGNEDISAIQNNGSGDYWICGSFNDTVDFDPSASTTIKNAGAFSSGFFAKYNDPDIVSSVPTVQKELLDVSIHAFDKSIYVDFSKLNLVDARVEVFNSNGQLIHKQGYGTNDKLRLDLHTLCSQVYVVKVWNKGAVRVQKVLLK